MCFQWWCKNSLGFCLLGSHYKLDIKQDPIVKYCYSLVHLFSACFGELNIIVDSLPKASEILEDMELEDIIEGPYLVSSL